MIAPRFVPDIVFSISVIPVWGAFWTTNALSSALAKSPSGWSFQVSRRYSSLAWVTSTSIKDSKTLNSSITIKSSSCWGSKRSAVLRKSGLNKISLCASDEGLVRLLPSLLVICSHLARTHRDGGKRVRIAF